MRGSPLFQTNQIFKAVNSIGKSKHEAKNNARENGARTWHDIGKSIGVHSYRTAQEYKKVWKAAFIHMRSEFGVKNIEKMTAGHVRSFLENKIEKNVAIATFKQYAAALEKLEVALNPGFPFYCNDVGGVIPNFVYSSICLLVISPTCSDSPGTSKHSILSN